MLVNMEQAFTPLSDVDPMLDDVKILVRVISIWKSHPAGKPESYWCVDVLFQDQQGTRIHATIKRDFSNKFQAVLDEGSCYKIGNFGVGENSGKFPMLSHPYKIAFYKNTTVTRVKSFDSNTRGFVFEPFQNLKSHHFSENDTVDVIGTVLEISEPIPYESYGVEKLRRTVLLEDTDGQQIECCFYEAWSERFTTIAAQMDTLRDVVMVLQVARVKYFNGKPTISNAMYGSKLYINDNIPEIAAFRKRYQEGDGYQEKKMVLSVFSPNKKVHTVEEFFSGAIKRMVGSIREAQSEQQAIVYAKIHKIHKEDGWWYTACKKCSRTVKEIDASESASASKRPKSGKKVWWCTKDREITHVGPKYKVIVRVIDDTGSASLLLYEDLILKLIDIPCYKLREKYGDESDEFPKELSSIVGKKLLFRFLYSDFNITNNTHVYTVKMLSEDADMISLFKEGFIIEDSEKDTDTPYTPAVTKSKFAAGNSVPFQIEETQDDTIGNENGDSTPVENATAKKHVSDGQGGNGSKGKREVVDLDEYPDVETDQKKLKMDLVKVKVEKED